MGAFDDLIPSGKQSGGGSFDYLVPKKQKRQVGVLEGGGRGLMLPYAKTADYLGMAYGGVGVIADAVENLFTGGNSTRFQDNVFSKLDRTTKPAVEFYNIKPDEELTRGGAIANTVGNLAGIIQQGIATGGATAIPKTALMRAAQGATAVAPTFALPEANFRAKEMIDAGVDSDTVMQTYGSNALINTAAGALPASAAGNIVKRASTGAAYSAGSGALARGVENQILGDEYSQLAQDAISTDATSIEGGIGAVIGALLGKRGGGARMVNDFDTTTGEQPKYNLITESPIDIADVIAELTGAPRTLPPAEDILRESDRAKQRSKTGRDISQGELGKQIRLYGDELPPQYQTVFNNEESAIADVYRENGINPEGVANAFNRARTLQDMDLPPEQREITNTENLANNQDELIANNYREQGINPEGVATAFDRARALPNMDLPQAQRDITNRENTDALAREAFELADRRQVAADSDIADGNGIAQDYAGNLAAYSGGVLNGNERSVFMVGDRMFEPALRDTETGAPIADSKGNVDGTFTDADGNTTEGRTKLRQIKVFKSPANPRAAQDFMAQSSQPKDGVGTGTMQREGMPRRSTDRISGDEFGGVATRNLGDPYARDGGTVEGDVIPADVLPKGLKQPRQTSTVENQVDSTALQTVDGEGVRTPFDRTIDNTPKLANPIDNTSPRLPSPDSQSPNGQPSGRIRVDSEGRAKIENETFAQQEARLERERVDNVISDYSKNDLGNTAKNVSTTDTSPTPVSQKQRLLLSVQKIREAADNLDGKESAELLAKADKLEKQAAKIKDEPVADQTAKSEQAKQPDNAAISRTARLTKIGDTIRAWLPSMDWATVGGRMIRDADGNVTGRTLWTPIDPEFGSLKNSLTRSLGGNISFVQIREANQKALDGKPLTKKEGDIVDATIRMHDDLIKQSNEIQSELDSKGYTDADADAVASTLTVDDINAELRYAGFDETTNNREAKDFKPESEVGSAEPSATRAEETGNDFTLERESNADIARRESELKAAQDKLKAEQKAFDDKKAADAERDNFTLSGSNRDADVAASKGQGDLLSEPTTNKTEQTVNESQADFDNPDYKEKVEEVKQTFGNDSSSIFYSGLPLDAMYKAVTDALSKMYNSQFVTKYLSDWKAEREAYNNAEKADKLASGTNDGGFVRGMKKGLRIANMAITGKTAILSSVAKRYNNSPTINKLVTMFNDRTGTADAGESGASYYQDIEQHFTGTLNKVAEAVGEKYFANPQFWESVTKRIKTANFDTSPAGVAAKKIAKLLEDEYNRLKVNDVELGKRQNYFPDREINEQMVINNETEFLMAATKAYIKNGSSPADAKELAKNWYRAVLLGDSDAKGSLFNGGQSIAPNTGFTKQRVLSEDAANELRKAGFYFDNPLDALTTYFYRTSRKAAFESRFGGDKWANMEQAMIDEGNIKAISEVKRLMPSLLGETPSLSVGTFGRGAVSFLQTANVITYLSGIGTLLTSIPEQVVGASRTGRVQDIPKAIYFTGRNVAAATAKKFGLDQNWAKSLSAEQSIEAAEMIGVVSNTLLNDSMLNNRLGGNMTNKASSMAVQKVLKWNGLQGLTRSQRAAMVELGARWMNSLATEYVSGTGGKLNELALAELGIPKSEQAAFSAWLNGKQKAEYGGVKTNELSADDAMTKMYREALYRFNSQTIMNPNKGQQPIMASHPLGKIPYSLMSYTYAYTDAVLKRSGRLLKEAAVGKGYTGMERMQMITPMLVAAGVIPLLQYALLPVRDEISGTTDDQKQKRVDRSFKIPATKVEIGGDVVETIQRSGVLGKYDPIVNLVSGLKYNRDLANVLLGASGGGAAATISSTINMAQPEKNSPNTNNAERKALSDWLSTVIEPTLIYYNQKYNLPIVGVPLQLAIKNKQTREAVVDFAAGKKQDKKKSKSEDGMGDDGMGDDGL